MTNTHQVTSAPTQAGRHPRGQRNARSRASTTTKQPKAEVANGAELEKITMLEIASWEGGRKTLSLSARISMATAIKLLAVASEDSKA